MTRRFLPLAAILVLLQAAPTLAAPAVKPAMAAPRYTLDTRLVDLAANPRGAAFIDRHFPGLRSNPHYILLRYKKVGDVASDAGAPAEALIKWRAELAAIR